MADEISITKVHTVETVTKPSIHLLAKVDTENGPRAMRISVSAAHELRAMLSQLPPKMGFQSPVEKL